MQQRGDTPMIAAIALLRSTADECKVLAREESDNSTAFKAEMMDLAARWHWLAKDTSALCNRTRTAIGGNAADCAGCSEKCLNTNNVSGVEA